MDCRAIAARWSGSMRAHVQDPVSHGPRGRRVTGGEGVIARRRSHRATSGSEVVAALAQQGLPARAWCATGTPPWQVSRPGSRWRRANSSPRVAHARRARRRRRVPARGLERHAGPAAPRRPTRVGPLVLLTSRCVIGGGRQRDHPDVAGLRGGSPGLRRAVDVPASERLPIQRAALAVAAARGRRGARAVGEVAWRRSILPTSPRSPPPCSLTRPRTPAAPHELTGPEPLTPGAQVGDRWPTSLGRPLRYEPVTDEEAKAEMAGTTPQPYIDAFFRFYSEGEFDDSRVVGTVEEFTCRARRAASSSWAARSRCGVAAPRR